MSRPSRASANNSAMSLNFHAQQDRDVVMGPPPLPPQIAPSASGDSRGREKDGSDLSEKYRKLKRKYFELEEKHKDIAVELRASGERSVKLRHERTLLADRITELEAAILQPNSNAMVYPGYPLTTAYPRALLTASAQKRFFGNLDRAMTEAEAEDLAVDPLSQSKHVGPNARKRIEAEQKERQEEEQRDARRNTRRTRGKNGKEKEKEVVSAAASSSKHAGPSGDRANTRGERDVGREPHPRLEKELPRERERLDRSDRERDVTGPPLTLAPTPSSHRDREINDADSPPLSQVLLASNGQRLRIKPPAPPASPSPQLDYQQHERPVSPSPSPPGPTSPVQQQPQQRYDHDGEQRRSPVTQRYDTRDDIPRREEYHSPERDEMDVDRDDDLPTPPPQPNSLYTPVLPLPSHAIPQPQPPPETQHQPQIKSQLQAQPQISQDASRLSPVGARSAPPISVSSPVPAPPPVTSPTTIAPVTSPALPPVAAAASAPPPPSPAPAAAMPGPTLRSASKATRKRSDSPVTFSPPVEDNLVPMGGVSGAQAAMMGQIVLSPPSPYRLTPVDPPPQKPAMQMTFRTSPATHVSQYGHSSQSPHLVQQHQSPNLNQPQPQPQNQNAYQAMNPNIDPQLYNTPPLPSRGPSSGGLMSPPGTGVITDFASSQQQLAMGNGSASGSSSAAGTPNIGPGPGPLSIPTPLSTPVPSAGAGGSRGKPKRLKAHTVTSKSYSIPMVPRDKLGKPMLPLNVGIMTVLNLGEVCMREHFHTERYIFPVGYEVTRRYLSTTDPNGEAVYHCTILDGGDGPKFQIVATDQPDKPVIAGTATGAWSVIVRTANHVRNRQHSNSVSGPDFFGLGQNTIKHLIQELPGSDRLKDYVWQNFVEGGPLGGRHAAVIPALPEDYEIHHELEHTAPGGVTGLISMTPAPTSPQPSFFASINAHEDSKELQIIHADNSASGNGQTNGASQMSMSMMVDRVPIMKPLTFQQEFPQHYKDHSRRDDHQEKSSRDGDSSHGGRRGSAASYASEEYERGRSHARQTPSHASPGTSRSPVMHRSPYQTPTIAHQGSPQVPPTFASIMHAYPAPPATGEAGEGPPYGGPPTNERGAVRLR